MISFVIPAHNESQLILNTLNSIRLAAESAEVSPPFEIVVVDDASTDGTAELARKFGAQVVSIDRRQISAARNAGAKTAKGDALIFVDADTQITSEVVSATMDAITNGAVGGGAAVIFDLPVPVYARILLPIMLWFTRKFKMAAGCYIFATRTAFDAVGGFDENLFAVKRPFLVEP